MITYKMPLKNGNDGKVSTEDLRHFTRDVRVREPAAGVVAHYEALCRSNLRRSNSLNGWLFEACIYDALIAAGADRVTIATHIDLSGGVQDVECDIIVPGDESRKGVALLLKTSVRERWAQWDRTGLLIATYPQYRYHPVFCTPGREPLVYCLFYREGDVGTQATEQKRAASIQQKFVSPARVITVLDTESVCKVFHAVVEGIEPTW